MKSIPINKALVLCMLTLMLGACSAMLGYDKHSDDGGDSESPDGDSDSSKDNDTSVVDTADSEAEPPFIAPPSMQGIVSGAGKVSSANYKAKISIGEPASEITGTQSNSYKAKIGIGAPTQQ